MGKLKVVYKKLDEIKPYEKNPRKNDEAVQYVKNSIEKFGFKNPIIVDGAGVIVAGHTRYKAAQELGMKEVPTISADDLTEEQIKAFRLADNKTAEMAQWDMDLLDEELEELKLDEIDMSDFGFGDVGNGEYIDNFFNSGEDQMERVGDYDEDHIIEATTRRKGKYDALLTYLKKNEIEYEEK